MNHPIKVSKSLSVVLFSFLLSANCISSSVAAGPALAFAPSISGSLAVGQTLSVSSGSWDSTPLSLSYQWFRCPTDQSSSCSVIASAVSQQYVITGADIGWKFQASVTALTAGGGTTVLSAVTGVVVTPATVTVAPVITGETLRGSSLATTQGSWNVNVTYSLTQWQRCSSADLSTCAPITGATAGTYVTVNDDVGKYIRVVITVPALGIYGSGSASSALFGPVSSAPVQIGSMSISGDLYENETVTAQVGAYVGYPIPTVTYQWQRCLSVDAGSCASIAGEISNQHRIVQADIGYMIRYMVTIINPLSGIIVPSNMTATIVAQAKPTNTDPPQLSGFAQVSYPLSATNGAWQGLPAPTHTIQWESCASATAVKCSEISGATSSSYYPVFGDALSFLRARITATNRVGIAIAYSRTSPSIEPRAKLLSSPAITGFGIVGLSYIASSAYWNGITKPVATQWQRCGKKDGSDCVDIVGETKTAYLMTQSDEGKFIRIKQWVPDEALAVYSVITGDPIYPMVETPVLAPVVAKPVTTTKPVAKPVVKATTITCVKGSLSKKVTAVSPKCPTGYKKK